MAQHVTFTCSLAEPSEPEEVELETRRSEEAILMAANHLDGSPLSDRSDRFDLHGRDEDEGLGKHMPSAFDQENSSLMNGGSLTRREEKEVSVFCMVSLSFQVHAPITQIIIVRSRWSSPKLSLRCEKKSAWAQSYLYGERLPSEWVQCHMQCAIQ